MEKNYDIILFGATGFTGRLIAHYLAAHAAPEGVRWAIAGRNTAKLEALRADLSGELPGIVYADVDDADSLHRMSAQTHSVMNAVGPFNWYGKAVVAACVANGVHYLDITGEPSFVADIYHSFGQKAIEKGVTVVNCCGFDSIPADFAAWLAARALPSEAPKVLKGFVRTNAGFSGGTFTTAIQALYMESKGKSVKVKLPRHPDTPRVPIKIHFNQAIKAWAIPMPVVDPHIVKRSIHALPAAYGPAAYAQFFVRSSLGKVFKTVFPIALAMLLVRFRPFREWLFKRFPPGTGPDEAQRALSRFEFTCIGTGGGQEVRIVVSGGDPGYNETAKMFSQAAFCLLAKHRAGELSHGVLTPVVALGDALKTRLEKEGIAFL